MGALIREELQRLLLSEEEKQNLPECELMQVDVDCPGNAGAVSQRAREALVVILSVYLICDIEEDKEEWEESVTDNSFKLVAEWFERSFPLKKSGDDEPLSDAASMMSWFDDWRDWYWWDAQVVDANRLRVYILLNGFPVSGFDSLRWLLLRCGAENVEQGSAVNSDEIAGAD